MVSAATMSSGDALLLAFMILLGLAFWAAFCRWALEWIIRVWERLIRGVGGGGPRSW